jgi:hypothetical protein
MAKINSINNATSQLTIDPGASGDSFVQFDINTTGEFRIGVDDDDSDSFKISQGSALGTNDTFVMTADGERTMPLQPAFLGSLNTSATNVTGDGTVFTIGSGTALTEVFDQGSNFVTTGTFTSPVIGRYVLGGSMRLGGINSGHTLGALTLVTSNGSFVLSGANYSKFATSGAAYAQTTTVLADMDVADTATYTVQVSNGSKAVDLIHGGGQIDIFIGGHLAC